MVNTSFQPNNEIRGADVNFWPENFTLRNYATVLFDPGRTPFLPAAGNSIVITILTVIIALVFAFLAAHRGHAVPVQEPARPSSSRSSSSR